MFSERNGGSALFSSIQKLMDVIDEENAILRNHSISLHSGFTDRKNQALRELMAAQRSVGKTSGLGSCRALLKQLGHSLQENGRLLKLNIAAVGEISDIIIGSLREADSDGTYSRSQSLSAW